MHLRQTGFSLGKRRVLAASLALLSVSVSALIPVGAAPVPAATPAAKKPLKAGPRNAEAAPATPAAAASPHAPEYADAWPSEFRPAPADLQLKPDDARKAEALAAFSKGLLAEDNADSDGMLEGYRRAVELDPGYAELAVKVAYELARRNDVSGAIQVLKDSIKAAPKEPLGYIYLSQLYSHYLKKPDIAAGYSEQALTLAPENFKSHLAAYELYDSSGQKAKADAVIARALKVETKDVRYWTDLGEFLQKIYLKDDGTCTPEELKRMNGVYERLAALAPDDAVILSKIADYYVLSKQVKEAIPRYLAVLKNNPDGDEPTVRNVREKLARSLIFTGQRDEAIEVLEALVKQNPQRFDTYELLGELYEQNGDIDKAVERYEHSLPLDTSEPRNHLRLADMLRQAKKYDKAIEMLQRARTKFPDLPFITYGLALAYTQAKRFEEALASFAEAKTDAEKRNEELLNAGFYFNYGAAAEQAGKLDKAAELLKQSIDLDPNAAEAYNYLGYMWVDRGQRLEEAGALIKKALELEPEKGAYLDSLGWFYFKRGDAEKAIPELLRAQENIVREEKHDDPTVLDHIGDAYSKLGKTPEALTYWQRAVAIEQEDKALSARIAEKIESAKQKVTSGPAPVEPKKD
jgi:tetratricopeptide (TPR) repeat protein